MIRAGDVIVTMGAGNINAVVARAAGAAGAAGAAMMHVAEHFLPRVRRDEPMSRHTSWHAGGAADIYFTPRDRADLRSFLGTVPEGTPIHFLGLGSNLLVRDGGIRGVVVATQDALVRLERLDETTVYGEAGVPCARIARQCVQWQLAGAEFFAGIPGTLGGALAMNAGAFGGETWNCVVSGGNPRPPRPPAHPGARRVLDQLPACEREPQRGMVCGRAHELQPRTRHR